MKTPLSQQELCALISMHAQTISNVADNAQFINASSNGVDVLDACKMIREEHDRINELQAALYAIGKARQEAT